MSTPSEKHSVTTDKTTIKDVLLRVADTVDEYRRKGDYLNEAQTWATLMAFAASMEQSAKYCGECWDGIKGLTPKNSTTFHGVSSEPIKV